MKYTPTYEEFLNEDVNEGATPRLLKSAGQNLARQVKGIKNYTEDQLKDRLLSMPLAKMLSDDEILTVLDHAKEELGMDEAKINEEAGSYKPGNVSVPGMYDLKWTIKDLDLGKGIFAKKYDFEFKLIMDGSSIEGETLKQTMVMSISDDSTGVYKLGKDVEKFSGLPLEDAKKYKETPDDAFIYGLVNIMNGGKDSYFWTNGMRLAGQAKETNPLSAVIEQVAHEVGVHFTRLMLTKMVAQKLGADITNEDWITYDYGFGEYCWPAIGDPNDKTPKIIAIDEETFATSGSAMISMLSEGFFEMATKYVKNLPKI